MFREIFLFPKDQENHCLLYDLRTLRPPLRLRWSFFLVREILWEIYAPFLDIGIRPPMLMFKSKNLSET